MATLTAGDTRPFTATLKIGTATVAIDSVNDIVTERIVDPKTESPITNEWTTVSTDVGADWPNGKVTVAIPIVESVKLDAYKNKEVLLVIQVESPTLGKKEWQNKYKVIKGYIA
jgi:hypothetical protein